ncbi:histone H3-K4 methyltransferase Set1 [Aureobasidium sp. EXF-10727]|nr:histone H3-K4 methyltransferase Set1 [Aureobasidium sp. EXF-10727]KAI4725020.1 histone H3-K4 methyltransferase Set1 [Aureobasidium sp. EXF-10728]
MSSSDSEARDSGDLLNAVGSTSSLASTVSSVFSANAHLPKANGHSSTNIAALTPLTYPASSPLKSHSPLASSKPLLNTTHTEPSPLGLAVAGTTRGPYEKTTPRPSPPPERLRIIPPTGKAKGYRTVFDPLTTNDELSEKEKKSAKVKIRSFGTESHSPPPDPRLAIANYTSGGAVTDKLAVSKTKLRVAPYMLKPYAYDKVSTIGPGPPKQIVVHSFDPFTPESQLKFFFASFGDIAEFHNQTDPNTGSFLGICLIKYKDSKPIKGTSVSAANAAKRAEKEGHNERIGLTQVKVELDREGRKCRKYVAYTLKKARHEMEKEVARHAPRAAAAESQGSSTPVPPPPPPPPAVSEEVPAILANAPKAPKGPASKRDRERERAGVSEQPSTPKERDTGRSVIESEPILAKIKRKPYIFISRDSVPVLGSTVPHLKKRFKAFDWREIRVDKAGYYVIFDDSKRGEDETVRCFKECNNGPMFTYNMAMECQQYGNPDYVRSPSPETQAVQSRQKEEADRLERWAAEDLEEEKKERAADLDPVKGALEQLQLELRNKIMDDIKKRIVIPELYDRLDPARHVAKRRKLDIPDPVDNENQPPSLLLNKATNVLPTTTRARNGRPLSHSKPLRPHDPNRGRQIPTNAYLDERRFKKRPAARPVHARPLHYRLQHMDEDEDEDESDEERRTPMTRDTEEQESRPLSRASRTSTPFSVSESIDLPTPAPKKRKLVHKERETIPEEEQEIFAPHHKELLGDLIQKIPERMATRELELVVSTLPRDSKFQERARTELHLRQRAKYDSEETPVPNMESTKTDHAAVGDKDVVQSGDMSVKSTKKDTKRKRPKSKKQIFEEREAERAAARAAEDTQVLEDGSQIDDGGVDANVDADVDMAEPIIEVDEEEDRPQVEWAVSTGEPRKTVEDDDDVFLDIDGWKHMVKDEEDMRFLHQALQDASAADIGDVTLWAWKQKEIKTLNSRGPTAEARIQGYYVPNLSGCARTEGVKKILESEKSKYLPHRIRVQKEREAREAQALENPNAVAAAEAAAEAARAAAIAKTASVATSRSNRANNRRLVNDINLQKQNLTTTGGEADAIKFNALKKRKKHVKFDRSAIHGWGLYAMENIASNDLIIEYVGEKVRQKVADLREIKYDKQGIGSSYLFRMADDEIIDATKKGGIARFINHSCTPNCTAKIIKVDGTRRIVIYALKDITKNDELTYDYKFEREYGSDDRIPCLCGSVGCKGFLN